MPILLARSLFLESINVLLFSNARCTIDATLVASSLLSVDRMRTSVWLCPLSVGILSLAGGGARKRKRKKESYRHSEEQISLHRVASRFKFSFPCSSSPSIAIAMLVVLKRPIHNLEELQLVHPLWTDRESNLPPFFSPQNTLRNRAWLLLVRGLHYTNLHSLPGEFIWCYGQTRT